MTRELQQALIHHRQGRLDEAASCYEEILSGRPDDFDALFYLAQVRAAQGRHDEGFALAHAAAEFRPDSVEAHVLVALFLMALRRPYQTISSLRAALAIDPAHPRALNLLGAALRATDRLDEAADAFRAAIAADGAFVEALHNLATLYDVMQYPDKALPLLESALALEPQNAAIRASLSGVLRKLGRWDEAAAQSAAALEIDPNLAEVHAHAGDLALELGKLDEAKREFERAIALAPGKATFYCRLAAIARPPDSDLVATLEHFAADHTLFNEERIRVHFALGKAFADLGEHHRGFDQLVRGNALQRALTAYDEKLVFDAFAQTAHVFSHDFLEARAGWGYRSDVPVFIVGMPRSGSTLVEQILASHPRVHAAGELADFQRHARSALAGAHADISTGAMQSAGAHQISEIGARYVRGVVAQAPDAARIVDKMPSNATFLGLIHLALPNARIIRTRRAPVDTCLSCFSLLFAQGQEFTYELGELGRYYRAYQKLLDHWQDVLPPGTILDVNYEDVVNDLESQARRVIAFCGLEWNEACLRFYETQRPVQTASVAQVRQPIYRTSVGRWRPDAAALAPLYDGLEIAPPRG
jgi:tetratricopeptide (TPR) repeat protein